MPRFGRSAEGKIVDVAAPSWIETTLASFIQERVHCPETVERYLRWQHNQLTRGMGASQDVCFDHLRPCGANDAQIERAGAGIEPLGRDLRRTN